MKKSVIVGVIIVMCIGIFAGCGPKKRGEFISLQEAYEQELLTIDDLKSIAYYQNNGSDDDNFVPVPKKPEKLSSTIESLIKETKAFDLRNESGLNQESSQKEATAEQVSIRKYLGTYGGYVAVMIDDAYTSNLDWIWEQSIGGVNFRYMDSNTIVLWKKFK